MNNITDLLDLEDSDIKISDIIIEGQTKMVLCQDLVQVKMRNFSPF